MVPLAFMFVDGHRPIVPFKVPSFIEGGAISLPEEVKQHMNRGVVNHKDETLCALEIVTPSWRDLYIY